MATEAQGAESAAGMPQLDFATFPNQVFWLVVTLVALYLILSRVALPRIAAVLAERRGSITNDIAAAEELGLRAREAETAYQKALADARAEAGRIVVKARAEIQKDLDAAVARADTEIAAKAVESQERIAAIRASAAASVGEVAREVAREIVQAFGTGADGRSVAAAVTQRMKG
ncbi:MAG: F0F1 ATP synthase subunit B' [Rhodobacteraceae bacterium]|nr:F0F1 ATP synthase subunit B' [Paracoccaceae bacterium]